MGSHHLPPHGQQPEAILSEIHRRKQHDVDALGSRAWSLVYYHSPELHDLVQKVYGFYIAENALNPMAFPQPAADGAGSGGDCGRPPAQA
jgi:glutamate/tyrosine decarboxylase-like PLP-dependent enzyme